MFDSASLSLCSSAVCCTLCLLGYDYSFIYESRLHIPNCLLLGNHSPKNKNSVLCFIFWVTVS